MEISIKTKLKQFPVKRLVAKTCFGGKGEICEKISENLIVVDGKLVSAPVLQLASEALFEAQTYTHNTRVNFVKGNGVVVRDSSGSTLVYPETVVNPTTFYDQVRRLLYYSAAQGTFLLEGKNLTKLCDERALSFACSKERTFAIVGDKIYYSDRDNGYSLLENYLKLPTAVQALATVGGKIVALGDEIFQIDFDDGEVNTRVTSLWQGNGEVFTKSVTVLGKRVYFVTNTGLKYMENGKVFEVRDRKFPTQWTDAICCVHNNFLWLSAGGRLFLLKDNKVTLTRKLQVLYFSTFQRFVMLAGNNKIYEEGSGSAEGYWCSERVDLGTSRPKHFKSLEIQTKHAVDLHLDFGDERKIFHIEGADRPQTVKFRKKFFDVTVEIFCSSRSSQMEVAFVSVSADLFGDENHE